MGKKRWNFCSWHGFLEGLKIRRYTPWNQHITWKCMVGRLVSFWGWPRLLVSGSVNAIDCYNLLRSLEEKKDDFEKLWKVLCCVQVLALTDMQIHLERFPAQHLSYHYYSKSMASLGWQEAQEQGQGRERCINMILVTGGGCWNPSIDLGNTLDQFSFHNLSKKLPWCRLFDLGTQVFDPGASWARFHKTADCVLPSCGLMNSF